MWFDVKMLSYYVINSSQTSAKNCLEVEQEQQSIQSQHDRWGHHLPPLQVHIVSEGCCQAEYPAQMMADSVLYSQLPGPLVLQDTDSHTLQSVGLLACCQCNLKSHEQLYQASSESAGLRQELLSASGCYAAALAVHNAESCKLLRLLVLVQSG